MPRSGNSGARRHHRTGGRRFHRDYPRSYRKAGELVADRYEADFDALYLRLATFPESGSPRPKLGRFIRIGLVSPYVVVYRHVPDDDLVAIIRIVHGRRRITRRTLTQPTAPHDLRVLALVSGQSVFSAKSVFQSPPAIFS